MGIINVGRFIQDIDNGLKNNTLQITFVWYNKSTKDNCDEPIKLSKKPLELTLLGALPLSFDDV